MSARSEIANGATDDDPAVPNGGSWAMDDDIVITGLSGRFPESSNIEEFKKNLMEGVDMVTEDERRWPSGLHGLPARNGKLKELKCFDAAFFGVHAKQARVMDPQMRMLLELTHEAIVDAGVNPVDLRGSRTGVFVGISNTDSEEHWLSDPDKVNGYELIGCSRTMFPNRISYTFDFKGPSFAVDTGSSSSLYAMHQAVLHMRAGQCDSAIVGGVNLVLKPTRSLGLKRLNLLSPDGACKTFDASANGYVRSESAVVVFLQKSRDARRIYSTVVHSKTNNDGYKVQGITFPCGSMQNSVMRELFAEAKIDPTEVAYIETHGTGTKVGDPEEVNSFADLFCRGREAPLLVGSVKTNMGHSEAGAALTSITKVLIAMETGVIPPNLHYKEPNPDIAALNDGRVEVVAKPTPWKGGLVAMNSFGFGGANAHLLLRSYQKPKLSPVTNVGVPKMVTVSGRTEEAVNFLLDKIEEQAKDDEFVSLIHGLHVKDMIGHVYRGYEILGDERVREVSEFVENKRPVWYVFSGMGAQWAGMGKQLWPMECFRRSLRRCADTLEPEGIDLLDLILNATEATFSNVLHSFVSITAVQVALVDVLTLIGIEPDGVVGHSVGELGCAYADGALTAEQTVLAAYWRGKSFIESNILPGAMAAVGLSWEEAKKRCPPEIDIACHNSPDLSTVSGPADSIAKFVDELKREDIFAKVVPSSDVAFHSRYVAQMGPKFRANLERIIPNSKPRSSRWISSSVPEKAWGTRLAQLSSPAYHTNNLLSPVLFQEALSHVPDNAIVIEIAPHCLLQSILRTSLPTTVTNIGLQKRDHPNNLQFFLSMIGKIYNAGGQPVVSRFYPPIAHPVGRGTPMLSSLVKWDHSVEWPVADCSGVSSGSGETIEEFDLSTEKDAYLAGHTIDGRVLFPATGYLTIAWKTFAKLRGTDYNQLPVVMENVQFLRATIMPKAEPVRFLVNIFSGTGDFEICEGGSLAVTGRIRVSEDIEKEQPDLPIPMTNDEPELLELRTNDIYKELRLRGYDYSGMFQGIERTDNRASVGRLAWIGNWITFMDTVLQFSILCKNSRDLCLPTGLRYVAIDPRAHKDIAANLAKDEGIPIYSYPNIGVVKSGGVELRGMKASLAPRRHDQAAPKYERHVFVPYENGRCLFEDPDRAKSGAITVLLQTVVENLGVLRVKAIEVTGERNADHLLAPLIIETLLAEPSVVVDMQIASTFPERYAALADLWGMKDVTRDARKVPPGQDLHLVVAANILSNGESAVLKNLAASLKPGGYILLEETGTIQKSILRNTGLIYVGKQTAPGKTYVLLKQEEESVDPIIFQITENNFSWLEGFKAALKKSELNGDKILLFNQGDDLVGLAGLANCIRREAGGMNARYLWIQDKNAPKFSSSTAFYSEQLKKQLMANVLKDGQWGSYRHLLLDHQNDVSSLQVEHAYVNVLNRGDLNSLRWIEGPLNYYQPEKYPGEELCSVYCSALNFRDVMLATGKLSADAIAGNPSAQDCILGIEFTGRDSNGRRVMAIVQGRGLATTALADPHLMWDIPDKWSFEEAVTIPVCYATSYYALYVRGHLKPGSSVLIHAGSGGVGMASIAICLHAGCKVFTTVGSQEKRDFLKKRFPQLTDRNIGNSRDTTFEQLVLTETNGVGVDIVLNSLADEKLQASVRCVAIGGQFLEIGKFDLSRNTPLGMSFFLKNSGFHGILLDQIICGTVAQKEEVRSLVSEGIKNGAVQPLPATVFTEEQVEQSFRFLASGKHIGKVLVKIRDEETRKATKPSVKTVAAIPRTYMNPDKSYVLVGGLGGFGLELANWMVNRGAKHIVLTSRSGVRTGYQSLCIRRWREVGINIVVTTADATTMAEVEKLIKEANGIAPVGGIFNLAAVLRDGIIEIQEESNFKDVSVPKIHVTKNLDAASRELCPSLDYFVCFSSMSCGRGNLGQANYGLANSAMERIVQQRRDDGFPGQAIQWGAIGDVGLILETLGDNDTKVSGTMPQRMVSCLEAMDVFLQQPHPILASIVLAEKTKPGDGANQVSVMEAVGNILGFKNTKTVNPNNSLVDLGMDSLMGTEIRQILETNYNLVLSNPEITGLTFGKLQSLVIGGGDDGASVAPASPKNVAGTPSDSQNSLLFRCADVELIPKKSCCRIASKI